MKTFLIVYLFLFILRGCFAQKIKDVKVDNLPVIEPVPTSISMNDFNFVDEYSGKNIIINDSGQYQFKDSCLADGSYHIWLHHDFSSDIGPSPYGYLEGNVKNGRKEGLWIKKIFLKDTTVVVKKMNYSNGLLNGDYFVFDTAGDTLTFYKPDICSKKRHFPFKKGTGNYYDYYYDTGILKEDGRFQNGKKDGYWSVYDRKGNEIKRDSYRNGVLVSD